MKTTNLLKLLPVAGLSFLMACSSGKQEEKEEAEAVKVKTMTVKAEAVKQLASYTATVKADVVNQITPAIPARIERIYVEVGTQVAKDQVLVQMESSSYRQQQVQLENLTKDYERYSELFKVGAVSQQQMDQLKTQIDALSTVVANLEENTKLKSPINGIVTARNYDNGDVFGGQAILTVQQLNPLKALIYVSEAHFTKVKLGMPVDITLPVYGDEGFAGKVSLIYPTIDPSTHTFGVEVTIRNPQLRVRPGMYARVTLNFGTEVHVVVPDMAVQRQVGADDKYVYLVENNIAKYQKITLGQRLDDRYEILSGLKDGDRVVSAGHNRLIDGTKVETVNE
ncbi:MAG: efflux RND transporter periplasmic adaptor subunit [Dysgonamonadaceae bacterium]|jgi:RND family efflux transporter MFP subunit|nr:efflux RND transporter periplasmic adaptor subunit [Dysgonamonadaceae bacterium]